MDHVFMYKRISLLMLNCRVNELIGRNCKYTRAYCTLRNETKRNEIQRDEMERNEMKICSLRNENL